MVSPPQDLLVQNPLREARWYIDRNLLCFPTSRAPNSKRQVSTHDLLKGLHVVAQLRRPGANGGGGAAPQVRGFQLQFNINLRAMLQGGVVLVLLYQVPLPPFNVSRLFNWF